MSELLLNKARVDDILSNIKDIKTRLIASKEAEKYIMEIFHEYFPDEYIADVSSKSKECDIYIPDRNLRIEVKIKEYDSKFSVEDKLLATMDKFPEDFFIYINLTGNRKTTIIGRLLIIDGKTITKSDFDAYMRLILDSNEYRLLHNKDYYRIDQTNDHLSQTADTMDKTIESDNKSTNSEDEHTESKEMTDNTNENNGLIKLDTYDEDDKSDEPETNDLYRIEAEALIKEKFGPQRCTREKIFDSVFIDSYRILKTFYISQTAYKALLKDKLKKHNKNSTDKVKIAFNAKDIDDYLSTLGCKVGPNTRWKVVGETKTSQVRAYTYTSPKESTGLPRGKTNYLYNLRKYIEENDPPSIFKYDFILTESDNKDTGAVLTHYPEIFLEVYTKFYKLNHSTPHQQDGCDIELDGINLNINLKRLLTYIGQHDPVLLNAIYTKIFHVKFFSYNDEVELFIKKLKEAINKRINFSEMELDIPLKQHKPKLYDVMFELKTPSKFVAMNEDRKKAYRSRQEEIDKIMMDNRKIIEYPNTKEEQLPLNAKNTTRIKTNGEYVKQTCYDFDHGFAYMK